MFYPWLKALHVAAAMIFAAGTIASAMLVPWLRSRTARPDTASLALAVRNWNRRLTTPAMFVVWTLGLTLAIQGGWAAAAWLQLKFLGVLAFSAAHGIQSAVVRHIASGAAAPKSIDSRPLALLLIIAIVVLAVAKPL